MKPTFCTPAIYFFDLFDTCITRMHAYPRDLFFDLGLRLAPTDASEKLRQRFAKRFHRARIRAEKLANWLTRRKGGEHADIHGIYRCLTWFMRLGRSTDEMVAAELALEEESLYPIPETLANIENLRASGQRIIFISDMYIPGSLLSPLLMRMGVLRDGDGLYVSCDMGCSKHSGRLFDAVLALEGLKPADVLHTGDNLHADIRMAQGRGIHTRYFTSAHLLEREVLIAARQSLGMASSWQAAFSRRCRLMGRYKDIATPRAPLEGLIYGVVVPLLAVYVLWLLEDARKRGIRRLYFVARDGQILMELARGLGGGGIELRYLYGSRRAWLAPSIDHPAGKWSRLLVVSGDASSASDITARAGLDVNEQARVRMILAMSDEDWAAPLSMSSATEFVNQLATQPACWDILGRSSEAKRAIALEYFEQQGLFDGTPWALVDSGWSLNSQAALKRILATRGEFADQVEGYYIALALDHLSETVAGRFRSYIDRPGSLFSRRRVVIEHLFLPALHGSTRSYKLDGESVVPCFSDESRSSVELGYAKMLHSAARTVSKLLASEKDLCSKLIAYGDMSRLVAEEFITHPSAHELAELLSFSATADMRQEHSHSRALCRPLAFRDIWLVVAKSFSKRIAFRSPAWMWLEGSAVISSPINRFFVRAMLWVDELRGRVVR